MIEDKYLKILCCFKCKGGLKKEELQLKCNNCHLEYPIIHGIPILLQKEKGVDVQISKEKWETSYKNEEEVLDAEGEKQFLSYIDFLSSYIEIFKKGIYLDLACGISRTAPFLIKNGVSFLGMDISHEGLRKGKLRLEKNKLKGLFIQANFLDIPIKDKSVDSIFWGEALEYVDDTKKGVKEAFRVLKKDGVIVATFPCLSFSTAIYLGLRGDIPDLPIIKSLFKWIHVNIFKGKYMIHGYGQSLSIGFVEKVFKEVGFKVKVVDYYDTYYPITHVPQILRPLVRRILTLRFFWPVAYIEAVK